MFGYQYLNGCNPVIIRKCSKLPEKFPVTHEMVEDCLERDLTLEQEIQVDTNTCHTHTCTHAEGCFLNRCLYFRQATST